MTPRPSKPSGLFALDERLANVRTERDRAAEALEAAVQVIAGDELTAAQQDARESQHRHDAWASRDQRGITDLDADDLHRLATTTPAVAELYDPHRYHQLEPPALELEAPSA